MEQSLRAVEAFMGAARTGKLTVLDWLEVEFKPSLQVVEDAAGTADILTTAVMAAKRDMEEYLISICDDDTRLNALGAALKRKAVYDDTDRVIGLSERCRESDDYDVRRALLNTIGSDADGVVELLWGSHPSDLHDVSAFVIDNALRGHQICLCSASE
ncbi:hypothetical protein ON010_g1908 [Phytophthora cinnamomi]|nr:hypothetical protein ON010_g1908 [Phytophthora cinnamomi]